MSSDNEHDPSRYGYEKGYGVTSGVILDVQTPTRIRRWRSWARVAPGTWLACIENRPSIIDFNLAAEGAGICPIKGSA